MLSSQTSGKLHRRSHRSGLDAALRVVVLGLVFVFNQTGLWHRSLFRHCFMLHAGGLRQSPLRRWCLLRLFFRLVRHGVTNWSRMTSAFRFELTSPSSRHRRGGGTWPIMAYGFNLYGVQPHTFGDSWC